MLCAKGLEGVNGLGRRSWGQQGLVLSSKVRQRVAVLAGCFQHLFFACAPEGNGTAAFQVKELLIQSAAMDVTFTAPWFYFSHFLLQCVHNLSESHGDLRARCKVLPLPSCAAVLWGALIGLVHLLSAGLLACVQMWLFVLAEH